MVTQERLRELFYYIPETGEFVRKISVKHNGTNTHKKGTVIRGSVSSTSGYCRITVDGVLYLAHRLAWVYTYGELRADDVLDHINRNRTDNRIANLRIVNWSQNGQNKGKQSNNTSGIPGVHWHKLTNKWEVRVHINKKRVSVGWFTDFEEAVAVRQKAVETYYTHAPVTPERIE